MPAPLKHVYCFRRGSDDCYKVGRTKHLPEQRKRGFATGSASKFTLCRDIETPDAETLETHIHALLDAKRAENGEFFHVTRKELDEALDQAEAFTRRSQPLLREAKVLSRRRPKGTLIEPQPEMLETYRELRQLNSKKVLIERRIEFLVSKMQVAIGENLGIRDLASWKWVERWTMDTTQFKKEHPALYEEYKRDSSSRKFRLEQVDLTKDILMRKISDD